MSTKTVQQQQTLGTDINFQLHIDEHSTACFEWIQEYFLCVCGCKSSVTISVSYVDYLCLTCPRQVGVTNILLNSLTYCKARKPIINHMYVYFESIKHYFVLLNIQYKLLPNRPLAGPGHMTYPAPLNLRPGTLWAPEMKRLGKK